jgi:hypothetical protein
VGIFYAAVKRRGNGQTVLAEYISVISWKTAAAAHFTIRLATLIWGDLVSSPPVARVRAASRRISWKSKDFAFFFCRNWALSLSSVSLVTIAERPFNRHGKTDIKSHTQLTWAGVNLHRITQSQTVHCFIVNLWLRIQEMDWCVSSIPTQARSDKLLWPFTSHHSTVTSENLTAEKRMHVVQAQWCSSPF